MDENSRFAIRNMLTKLNNQNKSRLFLLTKYLLEYQEEAGFAVLDTQNAEVVAMFENYPDVDIAPDNYGAVCDIYVDCELFKGIRGLIGRTKPIAKLAKVFKEVLEDAEAKVAFVKFADMAALLNLVRKSFKSKSYQDMVDYRLFEQMRTIRENLSSLLNLDELNKTTISDEEIAAYMKNVYNYQNAGLLGLISEIGMEEYGKIYDLFDKFQY